ncbi:hypothetical protein B0J13DRAFT_566976 [Dactylonectria estremocensis]|uniref:Leucine-rich repeat domain-containing protein n=1 Tax=Dactylonectria estremocensis TaxID=1079267 RepID=A0A9P9DNG7_9HYPO|nr:hypothetical protein B0J13DRAFT_566976 [Dactylonectria estremocensis]
MVPQTRSHSASLLRLSPEIHANILSHLVPSSIDSIHAVLHTCKQLYELALSLSVHTFRDVGGGSLWEPAIGPSNRLKFLRYVTITKPFLAHHVKCLIFEDFTTKDSDKPETTGPRYTDEDLEKYQDLIKRTVDEEAWQREWLEDFSQAIGDAEVSLLLAACPNLEQLFFGEPYNPVHFLRVIEISTKRSLQMSGQTNAMESVTPLLRLKEFYHESIEGKYGYLVWSEYAKAFQLPRLRSYECVMANGSDHSAKAFEDFPKRSSNVDSIMLRRSCITSQVLQNMTAACKALRSFEYSRGVYHMYDHELMPRDLLEALLPHASTLEYLHVNFEDDWAKNGWEDVPDHIFMGAELRQMTALRKLVAGMQALTGMLDGQPEHIFTGELPLEVENAPRLIECVPRNLEHLEIHGCGKRILPQAQELLDLISTSDEFRNLQRVRFLFNAEKIEEDEIDLKCSSSSVQLDIVLQSDENRTYDLIRGSFQGGVSIDNVCTRIYSRDSRERWLKFRCSDQARATVNEGVLYEPGFTSSTLEDVN